MVFAVPEYIEYAGIQFKLGTSLADSVSLTEELSNASADGTLARSDDVGEASIMTAVAGLSKEVGG